MRQTRWEKRSGLRAGGWGQLPRAQSPEPRANFRNSGAVSLLIVWMLLSVVMTATVAWADDSTGSSGDHTDYSCQYLRPMATADSGMLFQLRVDPNWASSAPVSAKPRKPVRLRQPRSLRAVRLAELNPHIRSPGLPKALPAIAAPGVSPHSPSTRFAHSGSRAQSRDHSQSVRRAASFHFMGRTDTRIRSLRVPWRWDGLWLAWMQSRGPPNVRRPL